MLDMIFPSAPDVLRNAYSVHAALDETFGRRAEAAYLWSMRPSPSGDAAMILVRSSTKPAGAEPAFVSPTYIPVDGAMINFAVTACPSWKSASNGKRWPFDMDNVSGRRKWFDRRALAAGLEVSEVRLQTERRWISKPIEGRDGRPFWVDATTYAGQAEVRDAAAFQAMLSTGFGPHRAWGLGLFVATPA